MSSQPNHFLVRTEIHQGQPDGSTLVTVAHIGPFATSDAANVHAAEHEKANPQVQAFVAPLIDPANC